MQPETIPQQCGIFEPLKDDVCNRTNGTETFRIVGEISSVTVPVCKTHICVLRVLKPHWQLQPVHGSQ